MNAIVKTEAETHAAIMENVLIRGDIAKLTIGERGHYYFQLCESLGLNALTQPFEYIQLNGKLKLYAKKDCTDQLRSVHNVSVTDLVENEREGVFVVKAKVSNAKGRTDVSTGAVNIKGLAGEALANALMKAETKAKRRATLSICGLGMLDETEIEDIPASAKGSVLPARDSAPPRRVEAIVQQIAPSAQQSAAVVQQPVTDAPHKIVGGTFASWADAYIEAIGTAGDPATLMAWVDANQPQLAKLTAGSPADAARVKTVADKHLAFLRKTDPISTGKAPAEPADTFPGDTHMEVAQEALAAPRPRGRPPKAKTAPDFAKDYDGWVAFQITKISEAPSVDALESINSESLDPVWADILEADKTALREAISLAEDRLVP